MIVNITELPFRSNYRAVGQGQTARLAPLDEVIAWAKVKSGGDIHPFAIALLGFSEGCQAVRAHLVAGEQPAAVVLVDGTHASLPKPDEDFEIEHYRVLFERARLGVPQAFIASHSDIRTDLIPQDQHPYMPTKAVLERITGWDLQGKPKDPVITREGNAVVYSCSGGTASDHVYEAREVLPRLLRDELAKFVPWAGVAPEVSPEADTIPPAPIPTDPPPVSVGEELDPMTLSDH